jgi:hypothetical protein
MLKNNIHSKMEESCVAFVLSKLPNDSQKPVRIARDIMDFLGLLYSKYHGHSEVG